MEDLQERISQLKDEHAVEVVTQRAAEHEEKAKMQAAFMLGRIRQNEHIAKAIATNLSAQTIRALEHFQQEKQYESLGYQTFVDFLEKSEYSPMSKRQYYDRLALIREHGDEIYDLLTSVGISVRAQKLLGKGDLAIKGDRLVVGDQEVEIGNTGVVKEVLEELFDERRELQTTIAKAEEKVEKQAEQLRQGQEEYERLERNLNEMREGDPHDLALTNCVHAFLELQEAIGQMPDQDKPLKGGNAIRTLFQQLKQTRSSYGLSIGFEDAAESGQWSVAGGQKEASLVTKVLAEDDDFGEENEVSE